MEYSPTAPDGLKNNSSNSELPNSFISVRFTDALLYHIEPEVITAGKNIVINSRPINAGLNTLRPNPLQSSFPKITAIALPNATTCNGVKEPTVKASKMPVMIAEPSVILLI